MEAIRTPCRICNNDEGNTPFRIRELMFGSGEEFNYFRCGACGCLQIETFPNEMSKYYPSGYYSFNPGIASRIANRLRNNYAFSGKGVLGSIVFELYPNDALRHLVRLNIPRDARILDVGCGNAALLSCLGRHGYKDLTGIDPGMEADRELKHGVRLRKASIEDLQGHWDFVMFHHSLEHMVDPLSALVSTRMLIAPGGTCLVRVPIIDSYAWERYGTNWVGLDAPRHFYSYSLESLRQLSRSAGMRILDLKYDAIPMQFWASEQYERDIPLISRRSLMVNPLARTFRQAEKREFKRRTCELNESGQGDWVAVLLDVPV
jgi:2-polyprenyl-3-methyl-5-hydroxy-6-metoxy-1,4-benzoquinol methylase